MHPFEIVMIVSSTSLFLITVFLLIIRSMPSKPGIDWWTASAALQSIAHFLAMIFYNGEQVLASDLTFFVLQSSVSHAFVIGTLLFMGRKLNLKRWIGIAALVLIAMCALLLSGQRFLSESVFAVSNSAVFALAAMVIFKSGTGRKIGKILGVFCVAVSLHWLDYPFLADIEWFQPIGFMMGMMLAVGMFLSLSAMILLQFRDQTTGSERRAIYSATHDPLTGLYNRSYLNKLFDHYVKESEQNKSSFILLYFDLDGFKGVNDKFGHESGDLLLINVAKRLEKWLGDKGDAIRVGGDEIIVLVKLSGEFNVNSAYQAARLLLDMIELPITDGKNIHRISSSIGGCSYQPGVITKSLDKMITCSDKQMYKAKQAGGHCIYLREEAETNKKRSREAPVKRSLKSQAEVV